MSENEISKIIFDAAIEVHKTSGGSGLMESVYEEALACKLVSRGRRVERQKEVYIFYKGNMLASPLRLDFAS